MILRTLKLDDVEGGRLKRGNITRVYMNFENFDGDKGRLQMKEG